MNRDPEIDALSQVYDSLIGLNHAQIRRIIAWCSSRFGLLEEKPTVEATEPEMEAPVEPAEASEKPVEIEPEQIEPTGFMKFNTVKDLFFASDVRNVTSKILLVAAFLHEKDNSKEFSSYEINTRLKQVGDGVQNITNSINKLLDKEPPLLMQTEKMGDTKQAKRKFRITEEGLRIAKNYLID